jgi:cytoskeleton-associated protein 5
MWPLMERFKEKKPNVIDALRKACDAIYTTTNLDAIQEICVRLLAHKTPIVRQQVALFLAHCFAMSNAPSSISSKLLMLYLPPLLKVLETYQPLLFLPKKKIFPLSNL